MAAVRIPRDWFCVDYVWQEAVLALVMRLERRGVLLTSYGNVAGADSLASVDSYWQERAGPAGHGLCVPAIRRIVQVLPRVIKHGPAWNRQWPSRAIRHLYLDKERSLPKAKRLPGPGPDPALFGHGELVAAAILCGFAVKFEPALDTGCVLRVSLTRPPDEQ